MALLGHIVAMKDDLHNLIFTESVLSNDLAQQQFDNDLKAEYKVGKALGLKVFSKETKAPRLIIHNSHPR
jgi:hypothetical protein